MVINTLFPRAEGGGRGIRRSGEKAFEKIRIFVFTGFKRLQLSHSTNASCSVYAHIYLFVWWLGQTLIVKSLWAQGARDRTGN